MTYWVLRLVLIALFLSFGLVCYFLGRQHRNDVLERELECKKLQLTGLRVMLLAKGKLKHDHAELN